MEQLQVRRESDGMGSAVVLSLYGPLTLATLHILEDAFKGVEGSDSVLDVGGAPYIDSAGLGTILSHWSHSQKAGLRFAVVGVTPRIAMMLEITKVNTILPMFRTADDAVLNFLAARVSSAR
jgi:anti-anti-sigma factor